MSRQTTILVKGQSCQWSLKDSTGERLNSIARNQCSTGHTEGRGQKAVTETAELKAAANATTNEVNVDLDRQAFEKGSSQFGE